MLKYKSINSVIIKRDKKIVNIKFFLTKKIPDKKPTLIVAIVCAKPPTIVIIAAFILSPFSRIKILPKKLPILFGKNIPDEIPVRIEINDLQLFIFSIGFNCNFHFILSK